MEQYSISEVIEQAVQTEKIGAIFYAEMAKKFQKNEGLKALFTTLAAKEVQHEKAFSRLKRMVTATDIEGWTEVSQYLRAIVESAFFLGQNKSLTAMKQIKSIAGAVDHALGFEKETLFYYYGIRDSLKDKQVIDKIIKQEKSHIIWLNRFRKSLKK